MTRFGSCAPEGQLGVYPSTVVKPEIVVETEPQASDRHQADPSASNSAVGEDGRVASIPGSGW